jgi:hypothetical protein
MEAMSRIQIEDWKQSSLPVTGLSGRSPQIPPPSAGKATILGGYFSFGTADCALKQNHSACNCPLLTLYDKDEASDLTKDEKDQLKKALEAERATRKTGSGK